MRDLGEGSNSSTLFLFKKIDVVIKHYMLATWFLDLKHHIGDEWSLDDSFEVVEFWLFRGVPWRAK